MNKFSANIYCVESALRELGLEFQKISDHPDAIFVPVLRDSFISSVTPFNSQSVSRLLKDKYFTHSLLKGLVRQPKTISFFDFTRRSWQEFIKEKSYDDMLLSAKKAFSYPMILKRNGGEKGDHVFLIKNDDEFKNGLAKIFRNTRHYDYLSLAQEYVKPKREYRVICSDGLILFLYEKSIAKAKFSGNLSPLHWEGSKAILIEDKKIKEKMLAILKPIFEKIKINWCGIDIIEDEQGEFWLIEINGAPAFDYFVRDNGEGLLVECFKKVITRYMKYEK